MTYDPITTATDERLRKLRLALSRRQPTLTVVLENVHDAHNVAAVLRSCDAVGVLDIHLVYYGRNVFPEFGRKASGSAQKWIDKRHYTTISECYRHLRHRGMKIYTTKLSESSQSIYSVDLTEPVAVVFGNEHDGVSEDAVRQSDGNILIPQVGMVESLNISVACAVTLFEASRQRHVKGLYATPHLTETEQTEYLRDWLQR